MSHRSWAALLAGAVAAGASLGAAAQSRPAYVKDVNEPGREPYNVQIGFTQSQCSANCSNFVGSGQVRLFSAPAVPAGKRLIVLAVSADLPTNSQHNSISVQFSPILSNQQAKWQYHGPFFSTTAAGNELWGMHAQTFFTVEPGQQPHVRLRLGAANNFFGSVLLSGYLIDAIN